MDKKKAICEYLRKNHVGKEKAIHSKELEKLFILSLCLLLSSEKSDEEVILALMYILT